MQKKSKEKIMQFNCFSQRWQRKFSLQCEVIIYEEQNSAMILLCIANFL